MKLPRDLSGEQLAHLLREYGYLVARQTGSHMRLTSHYMRHDHSVTIPAHNQLKIGTLAAILGEVANYLEITREDLVRNLFDR